MLNFGGVDMAKTPTAKESGCSKTIIWQNVLGNPQGWMDLKFPQKVGDDK